MLIESSTIQSKHSTSACSTTSQDAATKGGRRDTRGHTIGQGLTVLLGAVAVAQGLQPASARTSNPFPAPPLGPAAAAVPARPASRLLTARTPPPPPPRSANASLPAGWSVNPNLTFVREPVVSSLLPYVDIGSAANPFSPPVVVNTSLPYHAPYHYETCHARTPSGSTMCMQGIAPNNLTLLANGTHPLTCNDTAHVFWTVENAAWRGQLNASLLFKNVVQFKNPFADQCCLTYESSWNICDDIYPSQAECEDTTNTCAMLTQQAQQQIMRGHAPNVTGETYDLPGTPGVCGVTANNTFQCINVTNLFNIPGGGAQAPNAHHGFVPTGTGCQVSAVDGSLSGDCGP